MWLPRDPLPPLVRLLLHLFRKLPLTVVLDIVTLFPNSTNKGHERAVSCNTNHELFIVCCFDYLMSEKVL